MKATATKNVALEIAKQAAEEAVLNCVAVVPAVRDALEDDGFCGTEAIYSAALAHVRQWLKS